MRILLRQLAIYLFATGILVWLIGGARRGFYVVSEDIHKIEAVTEIEYTDRHDKFLPGIEPLALGLISGGSIFLFSFLFPKLPKPNSPKP